MSILRTRRMRKAYCAFKNMCNQEISSTFQHSKNMPFIQDWLYISFYMHEIDFSMCNECQSHIAFLRIELATKNPSFYKGHLGYSCDHLKLKHPHPSCKWLLHFYLSAYNQVKISNKPFTLWKKPS